MIFRKKLDHKLVEINRLNFLNDKEYIENILIVYNLNEKIENQAEKENKKNNEKNDEFNDFLKKYEIPNIY